MSAQEADQPPGVGRIPDYVAAIDRAELVLGGLWETLAAFRSLAPDTQTRTAMFSFQEKLAVALFELDDVYRQILAHKAELVAKKTSSHPGAFSAAMRECERAKKALTGTMKVGRSLGDAFAWIFYSQSQTLLSKHFAHPSIAHTPPGLGGQGELALVKSIRSDTHILLYHGITSFLRVGDVSFIDLATLKVTAIAELKTSFSMPNNAHLEMTLLVELSGRPPRLYRTEDHKVHLSEPPIILPADSTKRKKEADRAKRQIASMRKMFSKVQLVDKAEVFGAYHLDASLSISREVEDGRNSFAKVSQSLLLLSVSLGQGRTLAERLLGEVDESKILPSPAELRQQVLAIMDPTNSGNSLRVGSMSPHTQAGVIPLFWLPCGASLSLLRRIYFQEAMISVFFNPVFFFDQLRARGFSVVEERVDGYPKYKIEKRVSEGTASIQGIEAILHQMSLNLMREECVLDCLSTAERSVPDGDAQVFLDFAHQLRPF